MDAKEFGGLPDRHVLLRSLALLCALCAVFSHGRMLQTMRATIEWSYTLLSEHEQALFNRLSVFVGGWTLEAAETVGAGDGIERGVPVSPSWCSPRVASSTPRSRSTPGPNGSTRRVRLLSLAVETGVLFSIDSDAHAPGQLSWQPYGCERAVACEVPEERVVNTWDADRPPRLDRVPLLTPAPETRRARR